MTTEGNENDKGTPGVEEPPAAGDSPCCGPACGCGTPAGNGGRRLKIAVCLAVAVAVCAILLYRTTTARTRGAATGGGTCPPLPSIAALNSVASDTDSVFLIVPGKDGTPPTGETGAALAAVEKTLLAKGIRTAHFTLQPGSPDYPSFAARVPPRGIAVLTKGKGVGVVSGPVSETSLMQAYVASTGGGNGCPPGGAASGKCP